MMTSYYLLGLSHQSSSGRSMVIQKHKCPALLTQFFAVQVNDKSPKNKVLVVGGSSADIDVFTNFGYKALSFKFSQ
ncbi:THO complex subunit 6 [Desmophyllum pertusum]|uniref:THO complex subunit 6 n=1 Tax=Desmophyllum pertusum TaxID=174260 RepID=A0A9W9YGG8_9CNID|nr:THO complex subunit 6 [Desmophyllum pertusum]